VHAVLPEGRTGARARLIVAGEDVDVTVADGVARIALPQIDLAEVVRIDWT